MCALFNAAEKQRGASSALLERSTRNVEAFFKRTVIVCRLDSRSGKILTVSDAGSSLLKKCLDIVSVILGYWGKGTPQRGIIRL